MLHPAPRKNDVQWAGDNVLTANQRESRADPIEDAFVGHRMVMRCRFGTRRHAAIMKTATAHAVSRPEQQYHMHVNTAEERAAIHVKQCAVAPDFLDRKISCAHRRIAIIVMQ